MQGWGLTWQMVVGSASIIGINSDDKEDIHHRGHRGMQGVYPHSHVLGGNAYHTLREIRYRFPRRAWEPE